MPTPKTIAAVVNGTGLSKVLLLLIASCALCFLVLIKAKTAIAIPSAKKASW